MAWVCILILVLVLVTMSYAIENGRLRRGEFTDTEFQRLCHNLSPRLRQEFYDGCDEYQKKLFGTCRTEELQRYINAINSLRREEGSCVMIFSDNPDFNGMPNCLVIWQDIFGATIEARADTVMECLDQLLVKKGHKR